MKFKLLRKDGNVVEYEVNENIIWFLLAMLGLLSFASFGINQ
jgi:hypothetical protein